MSIIMNREHLVVARQTELGDRRDIQLHRVPHDAAQLEEELRASDPVDGVS